MEARSAGDRRPPLVVGNKEEEEEELASSVMLLANMPPGFRFHPTDEEIIIHYLLNKLIDPLFSSLAIADVDLNKSEPWDLPKKAMTGEKEWFLFWQRDKKYPTGKRTNRATESGYWKATGKDKEIHIKGKRNRLVGMRKTLVFYKGRAPKGENTNWVMHEFRLEGNFSHYNFISTAAKEEWVVCRVFKKKTGTKTSLCVKLARMDSFVDHLLDIPTLSASSSFLTHGDHDDEDKIKNGLICGSSSRPTPTTMYQNGLPPLCNYSINPSNLHNPDPNPTFINPRIAHPNSVCIPHQSSSSLGDDQLQNIRMCKMEPFLSSHKCVISHETINSVQYSKGEGINESNKAFDDQQLDQCLSFSPNISDLDSLWSF